jgi:hypothetical protein
MIKTGIQILVLIVAIVFSIFVWEKIKNFSFFSKTEVTTTHNIVLKEMTALGKLELVKYAYRDVVEQNIAIDFLPDPKAILIVQGEAIGCMDLSKIKAEDIHSKGDTLIVTLPEPEVCQHRIDHSKSKIYNTEYAFMNESLLIDEAYKKAEVQILSSALSSDILTQTQKNGELLLRPLIENLSKKKVVFKYELSAHLPALK